MVVDTVIGKRLCKLLSAVFSLLVLSVRYALYIPGLDNKDHRTT